MEACGGSYIKSCERHDVRWVNGNARGELGIQYLTVRGSDFDITTRYEKGQEIRR